MPTYECDQCGACCRKSIIEIQHLDVVREPSLLPVVQLLRTWDDAPHESEWDKEYILTVKGGCPMLGADSRCTIYPTRPNVCVGFEAGSEQCQDFREAAKLPPLLPVGGAA